jgi:hypothetical protein
MNSFDAIRHADNSLKWRIPRWTAGRPAIYSSVVNNTFGGRHRNWAINSMARNRTSAAAHHLCN